MTYENDFFFFQFFVKFRLLLQVLGCCFEGDGGVVTCGEGHAFFWKKEGNVLVKKKGVFGRKATAQTLLCCSRLKEKVRR